MLLMPPAYVKPYVKRGKTDAADAEAICEAVTRPTMRFVPVKSEAQQAAAAELKVRQMLVAQRTRSVNALRGHLAEFGIVAAKGIGRVADLAAIVRDPADGRLPSLAREALLVLGQDEAKAKASSRMFRARSSGSRTPVCYRNLDSNKPGEAGGTCWRTNSSLNSLSP
jgi:transposase